MAPAKKAAPAAKRSKVMGGAEDDIITDDPVPAEAEDPALSSRAKDELFGDAPKTKEGVRPVDAQQASADKPTDAVVTEAPDLSPPERHEHTAHESADAVEDDADYDAEEVEAKP
jgi:hypothetical protein